jgi:uncharacterized protein YdeI (YjbR/CyaY-like superfamily)
MSKSADLNFVSPDEWRLWLEQNHFSEGEAWVIIQKKNSPRKGLRYEEAVEEAVCFGWIDSKMQRVDGERFRQRFSPRKNRSIWSKKNKETAQKMIQAGKMTESGLAAIKVAKENGMWDMAYSSKTALTIPDDLKEALKANMSAWENFSTFTNSEQLRYVYWVNTAKKAQTRQRRIAEVVKNALNKA